MYIKNKKIMLNKIVRIRISEKWNSNGLEWALSNSWGGDSDYFVNEKNSVNFTKTLKTISNSNNKVKKGDVVYASKASEIPRFKLKEFIKDNGLTKTSRYAYADVIIMNRGYFNDLSKRMKSGTYVFVNEDLVTKEYQKWTKNVYTHHKNNLENLVKNNKVTDSVMVDEYTVKNINQIFSKHPADKAKYDSNTYELKGIFVNLYREAKIADLIELIYSRQNDIMSGKCKIIFDEDLFVDMNKEGIELDEEYLKTLRDMLFSEDKSNVKLGFEMMSNLVIDQPTLLSMAFLLNELFHQTNFRPSYYTSGNSNLKSLLKVFKTKGIYWERDWKTFGTGLRLNFKDGKEGEIVKKFLLDNINREFKLSNSAAESLVDIVFSTEAQ